MSVSTSSCVSTLDQQQQQIQQAEQCAEEATGDRCKNLSQRCTVVENGRVVVKPLR
ncbi:hypothetical protein H6F90_22880 [Trichocoleus sp. FACHB-591]|uniref:hypothetical protein n=1 Tax=unclassified Trichocoleus TaxID=2628910 RepID=UPI0016884DBA|nr:MULTISPECIES: hypothetical protein [unclassified Trichocoleus]MBD2097920.1 hypothetical protein [Trichocoleus sp. FACHB-591]MBD2123330.1 hypothetical protein [Trichocoleus sp. FACHB-262]